MFHSRDKQSKRENWFIALIAFIVLFSVALIFSDTFRTSRNITNLIVQITPLGLITLGQMFVIITGGIDLSVGSVLSLATAIAANTMKSSGIISSILMIYELCIIIGLINGLAVSIFGMNSFVTTLATMIIAQGLTLHLLPAPGGIIPYSFVKFIMRNYFIGLPIFVWFFIASASILSVLLYKTRFGLNLYAVGGNKSAASLSGIPVRKTLIMAYVLSSIMAASSGLLMTARISCGDPLVGQPYVLDSIGAAAIGGVSLSGGRGGIICAVIGTFIIGSISNILNMFGVTPYWQYVLKSVMIISAITLATKLERLGGRSVNDN